MPAGQPRPRGPPRPATGLAEADGGNREGGAPDPPANVRLLEQSDPALSGEPVKGAGSGGPMPAYLRPQPAYIRLIGSGS
jgi:hypothetical protein